MIRIFFLEFNWTLDSLKDILDIILVPVVLAIFGLLIPWIWDKKLRNSETRTKLVTEISELVMSTVMTLHLTKEQNTTDGNTIEGELDKVYKRWMVETCVIGSKLHAYFPDPEKGKNQIHKKWHAFSDRLDEYYKKK